MANCHLSFKVRASRGHLPYKEINPREARTFMPDPNSRGLSWRVKPHTIGEAIA
jgi:hypothetical protein